MTSEEALRIIEDLSFKIHRENASVIEEVESKAEPHDVFNAVTDRYFYREPRELPSRRIDKETIYKDLVERTKLDRYFSIEDFENIYNVCVKKDISTFYFTAEFCSLMKKYVVYKEYKEEKNEDISFETFVREEIYEKLLREEEYKAWQEETEEIQENFVPRTNAELKQIYEKYQFFLDKTYRENVDELGCMDLISFAEFLRMFDRADRNYRNADALVDHRIMTEIVLKYYELFVEQRGYQEIVSFREFWKMFNKCKEMENRSQFKLNMTNLIDQYVGSVDYQLDDLYTPKKRV